ncbi:hypothetical protein B0920_24835 [Massilia sp. KIM]|uniref:pilus assembly FimT family protein n=1 Tax=Massilia sp. KIM TaxID=1955422 RepID=UPI0009D35E59|nr:type II secretion system protein [Massilia sp. KIM]OON59147.1 hypothetical protein B0920_24835 [Massilia sp. KIM]
MKRQHGFTFVELITVIILIGVLAAIGVPRLMGENTTAATVFGDQVTSALRQAQKTAVARRRVVCATLEAGGVRLRLRQQPTRPLDAEGAGACGLQLAGVADNQFDSTDTAVSMSARFQVLYFHPNGTISTTPSGSALAFESVEIRMSGATRRTIKLQGSTGYVN